MNGLQENQQENQPVAAVKTDVVDSGMTALSDVDLSEFRERVEQKKLLFLQEANRLQQEATDGTLFARCPDNPGHSCDGSLLIRGVGTITCPASPCPHAEARAAYSAFCVLKACGYDLSEQRPLWERVPEDVRGKLKQYACTIVDRRRDGSGFLLMGPSGSGKTTATGLIAIAAREAGLTWHMVDSNVLVSELHYLGRSGRHTEFDGNQGDARERDAICREVDFLCLDDVGAENQSQLTQCWDAYSAIINHRYRRMMPTIITTNLSAQDFRALPHFSRLLSRLASRCAVIATTAESQRAKARVEDWFS